MARLRKPSPYETIFTIPSSEARATRSSPRKLTSNPRYISSSDDDDGDEPRMLVPKASRRAMRQTDPPMRDEIPRLYSQDGTVSEALTPRKQRVLRPVESNSCLLKKPSAETLAKPERRERRVRSGTTDTDVGKRTGLMYAKSLARSVVKKQAEKGRTNFVQDFEAGDEQLQPTRGGDDQGLLQEEHQNGEVELEHETSILCGGDHDDENEEEVEEEDVSSSAITAQTSSESSDGEDEEDEDPVVTRKQRQHRPAARRVVCESDGDETEDQGDKTGDQEDDDEDIMEQQFVQATLTLPLLPPKETLVVGRPQELTSMRPPHRKGKSTISNWAQEVVDLTGSPEPPASFMAPPPARYRTESFAASSRPTSSMSSGALAVLTYSPTPTKQRSPCKAPPISRPATPPIALAIPSKLVSPSKKKPTIPKADDLDGRPSLDAFWNPAAVIEWNERHSPVKPLVSPKKQKWRDDIVKMMEGVALEDSSDEGYESPTTSPKKKPTTNRSPVKKPQTSKPSIDVTPNVKAIRAARKAFSERKHEIAAAFLTELDTTLCSGRITALSAATGGIKLVWSKTLKTTAGRANWRREQLRLRTGPLPTDIKLEIRHHCSIELAEKVIDDEERLYNVLAHEFCHLTTFMISEVRNNPHGADFKNWGRQATSAFAHLGVEVTTKHSYQIDYKYVWECVACGYEFKRHSKSVDTARHSCGKCKGKLVQTRPTPRAAPGAAAAAAAGVPGKREKTAYQVFVKEHFKRVKAGLEQKGLDAQMGRVMEVLGREYREAKVKAEAEAEIVTREDNKVVIDLDEVEDALDGLRI